MIGNDTVASNKDVVCHRLSKNFDFEDIRNDLLSLAVEIGMHQCDIVVTYNDVAECRKALLYSLNSNGIGYRVTEVLEFLVCSGGRYEETVSVTGGESSNYACTTDGGMYDRNNILKFSLKCRIEICASAK